jgi:hypothetical protein
MGSQGNTLTTNSRGIFRGWVGEHIRIRKVTPSRARSTGARIMHCMCSRRARQRCRWQLDCTCNPKRQGSRVYVSHTHTPTCTEQVLAPCTVRHWNQSTWLGVGRVCTMLLLSSLPAAGVVVLRFLVIGEVGHNCLSSAMILSEDLSEFLASLCRYDTISWAVCPSRMDHSLGSAALVLSASCGGGLPDNLNSEASGEQHNHSTVWPKLFRLAASIDVRRQASSLTRHVELPSSRMRTLAMWCRRVHCSGCVPHPTSA